YANTPNRCLLAITENGSAPSGMSRPGKDAPPAPSPPLFPARIPDAPGASGPAPRARPSPGGAPPGAPPRPRRRRRRRGRDRRPAPGARGTARPEPRGSVHEVGEEELDLPLGRVGRVG